MSLSQSRKSTGFTLVELLVVISIVTLLAALITTAAFRAITTAKTARIGIELANIEKALERYKLEYGEYPPDFSEVVIAPPALRAQVAEGLIDAHLQRIYRRRTQTAAITAPTAAQLAAMDLPITNLMPLTKDRTLLAKLNPTNALVFWLQGTCSDPAMPMFGAGAREPLFGFDTSRLDADVNNTTHPNTIIGLVDGAPKVIAAPYYPQGQIERLPYVYYRSNPDSVIGLGDDVRDALATGAAITPSVSEPLRAYVDAARWVGIVNGPASGDPYQLNYQLPLPYFRFTPDSDPDPLSDSVANPATPDAFTPSALFPYAAPKKFQIVSAGMGSQFGLGGVWSSDSSALPGTGNFNPTAVNFDLSDGSSITSFSGGKALEDLEE